jgi:ATP-dependent RNA helicase DeaD
MDHMRRGTLDLRALSCLVLDEADEMLRMGFIDDVEWVLEQTPPERQVALFSATMPPPIRKIAERYLRNPEQISIRLSTTTAATIRQRYWVVSGLHKLDALTRILETENYEGVLIFVRTKLATVELAERLDARGYSCAAISGDVPQKLREKTIDQLKEGKLDILVATDVAARGLDVERISHVINFDIPNDSEVYVHRIGRTGRAGRHGDAILFVAPREQHMLRVIERATRQPIERMDLPSTEMVNDKRIGRFMQTITDTLATADLELFAELVERYQREHDVEPARIAAALASMVQGDQPLLLEPPQRGERHGRDSRDDRPRREAGQWDKRDAPRAERGYERRPPPREQEARPLRTENDAPRRFDEQRPRFGDERPPRRDGERPPFGDRPPRREGERPAYGDRPPRAAEERGPRRDDARPSRFPDERPPRFQNDRPDGDRPPRFQSDRQDGDRPPRFQAPDSAPRADGDRPPRFAAERGPRDAERRPFRDGDAPRPPHGEGDDRRAKLGVRTPPPAGMEGFRLEVGHRHGVMPGNIVGAIANEAGIDSRDIGRIQIHDDYSTVDLPIGMPNDMLSHLKRIWVGGQQLQISRLGDPTTPRRTDRVRDKDHKKDRHRDRKNKGAPKGPSRRP